MGGFYRRRRMAKLGWRKLYRPRTGPMDPPLPVPPKVRAVRKQVKRTTLERNKYEMERDQYKDLFERTYARLEANVEAERDRKKALDKRVEATLKNPLDPLLLARLRECIAPTVLASSSSSSSCSPALALAAVASSSSSSSSMEEPSTTKDKTEDKIDEVKKASVKTYSGSKEDDKTIEKSDIQEKADRTEDKMSEQEQKEDKGKESTAIAATTSAPVQAPSSSSSSSSLPETAKSLWLVMEEHDRALELYKAGQVKVEATQVKCTSLEEELAKVKEVNLVIQKELDALKATKARLEKWSEHKRESRLKRRARKRKAENAEKNGDGEDKKGPPPKKKKKKKKNKFF